MTDVERFESQRKTNAAREAGERRRAVRIKVNELRDAGVLEQHIDAACSANRNREAADRWKKLWRNTAQVTDELAFAIIDRIELEEKP